MKHKRRHAVSRYVWGTDINKIIIRKRKRIKENIQNKLLGKFQRLQNSLCIDFPSINGWWLLLFWILPNINKKKLKDVDHQNKVPEQNVYQIQIYIICLPWLSKPGLQKNVLKGLTPLNLTSLPSNISLRRKRMLQSRLIGIPCHIEYSKSEMGRENKRKVKWKGIWEEETVITGSFHWLRLHPDGAGHICWLRNCSPKQPCQRGWWNKILVLLNNNVYDLVDSSQLIEVR